MANPILWIANIHRRCGMLRGDSSKESEDIRREGKFTRIGSNVWKFSQILCVMMVDSRHRC